MKGLGAELIRTPNEAAHDSPESNMGRAAALLKEIPHAVMLNQYDSPDSELSLPPRAPSPSAGARATDFSEPTTSVNHNLTKRTSRSSMVLRTNSCWRSTGVFLP